MDAQQARSLLVKLAADLSPEEEYAIRHEDYVMEMPQESPPTLDGVGEDQRRCAIFADAQGAAYGRHSFARLWYR